MPGGAGCTAFSDKLADLTGADVAAMVALHARSFPSGWRVADFSHMLEQPAYWGIAAYEREDAPGESGAGSAGQMAGFILCRDAACETEVMTFCTAPHRRRQGIGRAVLDAALARARQRRIEAVFLEVDAANVAAQQLYLSAGFSQVAVRPAYYVTAGSAGGDAWVMRCTLA